MRNCKKCNCPLHHYLILIRTNRHLFHDELSICNKRDFCIVFGRFEWNTEKSAWFSYDAKPSRKIHHAFVSPSQVLWLKLVIIRFALFAKWNVIMEMTVKTAKKDVLKPAKLLELRNFNFPYLDVKDRAESKIQFARFKICRNYLHWASFIFLLQIILYEVFFYWELVHMSYFHNDNILFVSLNVYF